MGGLEIFSAGVFRLDPEKETALAAHLRSAELYASASKTGKRPMRYTRFKSAAEAIKYAVEVLPPELLIGSTLEVNEERFDGFGIRALYESANYPLRRRKTG